MGDYLAAARHGAPGVVVVHDWFGLSPGLTQQCHDLVDAGFTALAVDLYDGRVASDAGEAEQFMEGLDPAKAQQQLAAAVRRLRGAETMARRVGAIGFSMGGWMALHAAGRGLWDAVVTYYAVLEPTETIPIPCPVQLHLAAADEWDPPDAPERFINALEREGTPVEAASYPATTHSFANDIAAEYAPDAAARAWSTTKDFLTRTLGS